MENGNNYSLVEMHGQRVFQLDGAPFMTLMDPMFDYAKRIKDMDKAGVQAIKNIAVLDHDKKYSRAFCAMLEGQGYRTVSVYLLADFNQSLQESNCLAGIIDLDTITIDSRSIRDMTINNPGVHFLCLSSDRLHPDLKEAIYYHIYACINKPVDQDELFYFLESIYENKENSKNQQTE